MSFDKPYQHVLIRECGEPMAVIPQGVFVLSDPHPYLSAGAPYETCSPWMLRQSILESLLRAQELLHQSHPGWKIKLFDAYRPNKVQDYLVQKAFTQQLQEEGLNVDALAEASREAVWEKVFRLWAVPCENPARPPPHSTGAAFDCTLVNDAGDDLDMGSPFDENSDRSRPDYFAEAADPTGKRAHANRKQLCELLAREGFVRNPSEWWHFSRGDQLATWADHPQNPDTFAIYGRVA
ncbi:MAG: M15 family metallopeptidase [Alphaproteobacteria bacterium]|nr:M15 family metallopeptidase [Alphaproteobacteria bacterium]